MDSYEIWWKRSAQKDLKKIDRRYVKRIIDAIAGLAGAPFPPGFRKLEGSERSYRIRVGDYRVVYQVDTDLRRITIVYIRHRKDAYRQSPE